MELGRLLDIYPSGYRSSKVAPFLPSILQLRFIISVNIIIYEICFSTYRIQFLYNALSAYFPLNISCQLYFFTPLQFLDYGNFVLSHLNQNSLSTFLLVLQMSHSPHVLKIPELVYDAHFQAYLRLPVLAGCTK